MAYFENLSFPIGQYMPAENIDGATIQKWMGEIAAFPKRFRELVEGLNDAQLDTPYRPGGWTIRQVVHHVPDSHVNSYIRFKWALSEDSPMIKAYDEKGWCALEDSLNDPIETSLDFLDILHKRWILVLEKMTELDWKKTFRHPESGDTVSLDWNLGNYVWHGNHHYAHIDSLRQRMGW